VHKNIWVFFGKMRVVVWAILDGLVLLTTPSHPPSPPNRVLIVRLDEIGDFVLWLDAARTLVSHYRAQGCTVVLLGNQVWASWANEMGLADEIWGLDTQRYFHNLAYRWHWLRRLRQAGFSIAILPTLTSKYIVGESAIRASGSPVRIGCASKTASFAGRWRDRLFSRVIPVSDDSVMELIRNAELMRGLGVVDFKARLPIIPPPSPARLSLDLPANPYVVLFPGASWYGKEWEASKFAEIGQRLMARGLHVVLAGGKADRACADELAKGLHGKTCDLVGKTSLGDLAELLRGADAVISNDTSAVHIGAAVKTPVVCVMGGGHYGRFAPYSVEETEDTPSPLLIAVKPMPCFGCDWHCIHPHGKHEPVKCIRDITVEDVWRAVEQALAVRKHHG
jgi:ADP-heptose:LPS heptosyltransferase